MFQPACDRLDPLGVRSQRHAGHPGKVRLLLDAPGIGQHRARAGRQRAELERSRAARSRACRLASRVSSLPQTPSPAGARACAGAPGTRSGAGRAFSSSTSCARRSGSSTLPARWAVTSRYDAAAHQAVVARCAVRLARASAASAGRRRPSRRPRPPPCRDPLGPEVLSGGLRRAQQEIAEMVGHDPVALLGHRAVEGAHARLDVHHRDSACSPACAPASVELVSP